jgi:hypothetical protein
MRVQINKKVTQSVVALFLTVLTARSSHGAVQGIDLELAEKDSGNLGEIRQSILSSVSFQKLYGQEWVLMDGRNIEESDLYREKLWANKEIPDARGIYLRGNNGDREDKGVPKGETFEVGDYLGDLIGSHKHDDHGHHHGSNFTVPTSHGEGGASPGRGSGGGSGSQGLNGTTTAGHANISYTGGSETRPRSIIVNIFIKINRSKGDQTTEAIFLEIKKMPKYLIKNKKFLRVLDSYIAEKLDDAIEEKLENRKSEL